MYRVLTSRSIIVDHLGVDAKVFALLVISVLRVLFCGCSRLSRFRHHGVAAFPVGSGAPSGAFFCRCGRPAGGIGGDFFATIKTLV